MTQLFELPDDPRTMPRKGRKTMHTGVLMEREYDAGNAGKSIFERENALFDIDRLEKFQGLCKGFTRGMRFCIRANGDVEPCTVGTMGKGYGNIHSERLSRIINKMRLSPVHLMFAKESFDDYLPYFSRNLFGSRLLHPCTFFGIISSIVAGVAHLRANGELTQSKIDALNMRIAKETGFILS